VCARTCTRSCTVAISTSTIIIVALKTVVGQFTVTMASASRIQLSFRIVVLAAFVLTQLELLRLYRTSPNNNEARASTEVRRGAPHETQIEFDWINNQLIGPEAYGTANCPICGCPKNPSDCPSWFTPERIQESVDIMDKEPSLVNYAQEALTRRAQEAALECKNAQVLATGGWCLQDAPNGAVIQHENITFHIPKFHVAPSKRVVEEVSNLISSEGIQSITDFGAGVGQYKAALLKKHPNLVYNAYDGAGNVVDYTHGFTSYCDLTYPLGMTKSDWVLSLEVGEHVPSRYEGMVIRNFHYHNCKGIILSWARLNQDGHNHINNHSNEYILNVMKSLGYTLDNGLTERLQKRQDNFGWFTGSIMAFRRNEPVC